MCENCEARAEVTCYCGRHLCLECATIAKSGEVYCNECAPEWAREA